MSALDVMTYLLYHVTMRHKPNVTQVGGAYAILDSVVRHVV